VSAGATVRRVRCVAEAMFGAVAPLDVPASLQAMTSVPEHTAAIATVAPMRILVIMTAVQGRDGAFGAQMERPRAGGFKSVDRLHLALTGATGFDGVSEAVAACPGRRAPGKTLGKKPNANDNFALAA